MVGTHWLCVTRSRSMRASAAAGSNRSITTTVPPTHCTARETRERGRVVEGGR